MSKRNKTNCKVRKHRSYSDKIASGDYEHIRHSDFTNWQDKHAKKLARETASNEEITTNE